MYYAEVFEYNEQKIYYVGDMVIYKKAYYVCQSTLENKNYVTGKWDYKYWDIYTDTVLKSLSKENFNKYLKYEKPYSYPLVSRYMKTRLILDEESGTEYHETVSNYVVKENENDKFITITNDNKNRLDIISFEQYGNVKFWWAIAIANNIIDAFTEIPIGTVLRIPAIPNLYKNGNILGS